MLQAMFSGVSGLQVHQTKLDVIGNNIANVNTIGFKAGRVTFEDQLSQTLRNAASPGTNVGGQNPAQVGLGVQLGAVDTLQTQGNLQTTGKSTDMALQGNGFFMVGDGTHVLYTRDGSFDLDSDGVLVNPANGEKLLGYVADSAGVVDTTQQITGLSILKIPVGSLTSVRQTTASAFVGNLDASSSLMSTKIAFDGNIKTDPTSITANAYDNLGNAHPIVLTLSGKTTAAGVDTFNAILTVDGTAVPGGPFNMQFTTATNAFLSTTLPSSAAVTGVNGASNFTISSITYAATMKDDSTAAATGTAIADGQTGPLPTWSTSINVYDSLGVKHSLVYKFTRQLIGTDTGLGTPPLAAPPVTATAQWDWTVSENGVKLSSSTPGAVVPPSLPGATAKNVPLYFDSNGKLINPVKQTVSLNPVSGSTTPFTITADFTTLTGLAGESSVTATTQDGYPVGTLQTFSIAPSGIVTGIFSNGQSQTLGQIATAAFSNPAGLEKQGGNLYRESNNSGLAQVGIPNTQGRGKINTGYVEMSNVDLSTEFTNLIITQRGFQANTRIITVVDQLLQEVIDLKR